MAKMRKEYDPNKVMRRKRRPIIYIICEGKETETLYFKHFRSRNCLVDIIPISSKHKAAEHLVKHAKSLISQADYYPKDGDQLWCVFDCDAVINVLKGKGYLENYEKSVDVFDELLLHQDEAINRAKERVERLTSDHTAVMCRDSNPVTTVYELVEFLNSKKG